MLVRSLSISSHWNRSNVYRLLRRTPHSYSTPQCSMNSNKSQVTKSHLGSEHSKCPSTGINITVRSQSFA
jgi:hypothetical protein